LNVVEPEPSNERPDPAVWYRPAMRTALAARDFSTVYRLLQKIGFSRQQIATFTGQPLTEVTAIVHGRRIVSYDVIRRVAAGLGAPPCLVGVSSCCGCHHPRHDNEVAAS
jgi:hypothetical protein